MTPRIFLSSCSLDIPTFLPAYCYIMLLCYPWCSCPSPTFAHRWYFSSASITFHPVCTRLYVWIIFYVVFFTFLPCLIYNVAATPSLYPCTSISLFLTSSAFLLADLTRFVERLSLWLVGHCYPLTFFLKCIVYISTSWISWPLYSSILLRDTFVYLFFWYPG